MALLITDDCTACDACKPVCPNKAITAGDPIYVIDPMKCTECVGAEDEPQCKLVCPADCIEPNPDWTNRKTICLPNTSSYGWLTAMNFNNQISQKLHDEHAATVALMERLEQLLARGRRAGPPDTADGSVARLLSDLSTGLENDVDRHFIFEEDHVFNYLRP